MLKRFATVILSTALVCTLGGTSAFAHTPSKPETRTDGTGAQPSSTAAPKKETQPNEKLKANLTRLVADAKAGKITPAERPQIQPAKRNNLSKGTKIAIGVAIAVAVVAVVLIVRSPALNDGR